MKKKSIICVTTGTGGDPMDLSCDRVVTTGHLNALEEKIEFLRRYRNYDYYLWFDDEFVNYVDDFPIIDFFETAENRKGVHYLEFDFSWPADGTRKLHIILATRENLFSFDQSAAVKIQDFNVVNLVLHKNLCDKSRIVHFIGDSHTLNNFTQYERIYRKCHILFDSYVAGFDLCFTHWIGARTMYSISKCDDLELFFQRFLLKENDICLLSFGEIDVRAHIMKQAAIQNKSVDELVEILAETYIRKVETTVRKLNYGDTPFIISGVIPPIDRPVEGEGQIATYGAIEEIVYASKKLNLCLNDLCRKNVYYFDVYDEYSNDAGVLEFSKSDHFCHISPGCSDVIHRKLDRFINSNVCHSADRSGSATCSLPARDS